MSWGSQESRCQGRGWAAPSRLSTAGWTSTNSERRGRERRAPRRKNLEEARSGTFPGPREGSGSPPHSVPRPQHLITPAPRANLIAPTAASPAAQPGGPHGAPRPRVPAIIQTESRGGHAGGQGHAPLSAQVTCLFRVLTWTLRGVLRLKGQSRRTRPRLFCARPRPGARGVCSKPPRVGTAVEDGLAVPRRQEPTQRRAGLSELCWRQHRGGVMGDPQRSQASAVRGNPAVRAESQGGQDESRVPAPQIPPAGGRLRKQLNRKRVRSS